MAKSKSKDRVARAVGLTPSLKRKTRERREAETALTETSRHAISRRNDLTPDLTVQRVPIDSLKPAPRRVRRSGKVQAAKIDASVGKYGQSVPVLVDCNQRIVHGHGVWEALRRAGSSDISVICVSHLSDVELRSLAIALNRLGETGGWDEDALALEFSELMDLGEDVVLTGFDVAEIDALLLEAEEPTGDEEDSELLPGSEIPTSRPGDLWLLGANRLLQDDALAAESYRRVVGEGEEVRVVITDPPYNVPNRGHVTSSRHHREFAMAAGEMSRAEFHAFLRDWLQHASAWVVDGGLVLIFMDWRSIELLLTVGRELGLTLLNVVVWAKTNAGQGSLWRSQHEMIAVFKKGAAAHVNNVELGRWGRWRSNVWTYPGGSSLNSDAREGLAHHPTVKPRALLADALLDISNPQDVVLDCFAGSGSTLLAAEATHRVCRAIEIDGLYCDVAIRRWQALTGENAVLEETGETFEEVGLRRSAEAGSSAATEINSGPGAEA
ncbi:methyltransferase [Methylopila jiangsuensis]|uniref:site-specific DNA-methyltransferase (adenine-specific) n=1 Tax=Methylopila jiangsuensis TaxID=586230 RepID=A0A9W6JJ37_9HYPH|nr:DNA methyltransferase [Methylopila jiangsuensis]MDR6284476.1 DNA modification methylase [Methylopila jiangsuensis]GLK78137.1 methyltransferase [Methylopila jiangsuensis]